MKTIAFFDFDGTLTTKDSMIDFARYVFGPLRFGIGMIYILPHLFLFFLNRITRDQLARRFIRFFFQGQNLSLLEKKAIPYVNNQIPRIINKEVYAAFCRHRKNNHDLVVVSASPFIWLKPWCKSQKCQLIATRLGVKNDILTGSVVGERSIGEEKVVRINEIFSLADYDIIYAYGNSDGDVPMLKMADRPFYYNGKKLQEYSASS